MPKLSLVEWDEKVKPLLSNIAIDARWLQYYGRSILDRSEALIIRPEWRSLAEAELEAAIIDLTKIEARITETLNYLKAAKIIYDGKDKDE